MQTSFVAVFSLILLLSFGERSLAFSGAGHMAIAAIAYRDLSANEQRKVSELLRHHPEYSNWTNRFSTDLAPVDLDAFIFVRASTWPDEIRRRGNAYDHPQWHYVDYPIEPPDFPDKPSPFPTNDILYGISQSTKVLKDSHVSLEAKAAHLSWLIHLVGDIHQPLHCSTLVNGDYKAPEGDKGGNSFFVKPNTKGVNLHSIWDQALGRTANPRIQYNYAIRISAEQPRTSLTELTKNKTPESWSKEGRAIAIEKVYLRGNLKGSATAATAPDLSDDYTRAIKAIAERQAALAGYRLANEIRQSIR